jgi:flavin-dependent dehydrogenase
LGSAKGTEVPLPGDGCVQDVGVAAGSTDGSGPGSDYDVVVVGGRIAGALTAALFAQRALRVLVVDRARLPASTLSTHFFRGGWLVRVIGLAGALPDVEALGAPHLVCEYNYDGGTEVAEVGPPQDPGDVGWCWSVRRLPLDQALLGAALRAGADVVTATTVVALTRQAGRVVGVVLADGSTVTARLVVGADGRRSTIAQLVEAEDIERSIGKRALYYRYVRGFPGVHDGEPDGPEFSLLGDELAYVFPSDGGLTCLAVSINLQEFQRLRHDPIRRFDELLRRHRGLWDRYATSERVERLFGSGPQDDWVRRAAGPGWALVGDSGLHQDPWSGSGMDCAGVSAALLVDAYCAADGTDAWIRTYQQARDDQMLDNYHETVSGAADLSATAT